VSTEHQGDETPAARDGGTTDSGDKAGQGQQAAGDSVKADNTAGKPAASAAVSRPTGRGSATALAVIALLVALAALGSTYLAWERIAKSDQALDDTRASLESRVAEFPDRLDQLASRIDRLDGDIREISPKIESGVRGELQAFDDRLSALHELLRKTAAPVQEPADIEHLLLIANDSLILQHDVSTALAALQTADDRLRGLADPVFAETRRQLAREIGALRSMPRPDITGAAFALSGLQQDIEALTLDSLRSPVGERSAPSLTDVNGEPGADEGWRALLSDLWSKLGSLVVIRRSDELEGPLLGPEQRVFLNQNLRLKLESARLSLLSRDAEGLRHHLEIARDWLTRYYNDADEKVVALLERLEELRGVDIAPQAPDISGSLKALRDALERRRNPILDDEGEPGDS
jgi:uroporphyrin-III C-methyltransferase